MNQHEREMIALGDDPELAARIVTNLVQVERDHHVAFGPLSDRFMVEAEAAMAKDIADPWKIVVVDESNILLTPDWKQARGVGHGDMWLALAEVCSDEINEYSWLAAAAKAGPTELVLELTFRRGFIPIAQSLIGDDKTIAPLLKLGFARDADKERLFLRIDIPLAVLAKCFFENDLAVAVLPVTKAVALAITAKTELDALIEAIRAKAKIN